MDQYALTAIAEAAAAGTLDVAELRKFIDPASHQRIKELENELANAPADANQPGSE